MFCVHSSTSELCVAGFQSAASPSTTDVCHEWTTPTVSKFAPSVAKVQAHSLQVPASCKAWMQLAGVTYVIFIVSTTIQYYFVVVLKACSECSALLASIWRVLHCFNFHIVQGIGYCRFGGGIPINPHKLLNTYTHYSSLSIIVAISIVSLLTSFYL